jgi:hypothetical protein
MQSNLDNVNERSRGRIYRPCGRSAVISAYRAAEHVFDWVAIYVHRDSLPANLVQPGPKAGDSLTATDNTNLLNLGGKDRPGNRFGKVGQTWYPSP